MTLLILERVSPSLRGDLSRWMIEIQAGVFIGKINGIVRDALWDRATNRAEEGAVLLVWRTNNEQGFELKTWQSKQYVPINIEGLWLTARSNSGT